MKELITRTINDIKMVRHFVELGAFDEDENAFPLDTFKYEPEIISDLLNQLECCAENLPDSKN